MRCGSMVYVPHNCIFRVSYASVEFLCRGISTDVQIAIILRRPLSKGCHLDVVGGPSTPHDSESDAGGSLSSWQGHPSR
jgi:hypothetical protein